MRTKLSVALMMLPSWLCAANLTTFWASDGYKLPRDICYPENNFISTNVYTRIWDGNAIKPFSGQNMTVGFELHACDTGGTDASSVTVSMSSMTCSGGKGITSVVVSSLNVTDTSQRPIQVFSAWYVQHQGQSVFPYGFNEYEERQYPLDMRVPCTVNGNNDCVPTGSPLWANRLYANMYFPVAWVPEEEFLASSETVKAGNSKSFEVDIWVSSSIPKGTCTGTFSVYEGPTLSTAIPVNLMVYGVKLPVQPSMNVIATIGNSDTDLYLNGNEFPSTPVSGSFLTGRQNMAKLLKAHNITETGDEVDSTSNYYPSAEYQSHVDINSPNFLYTAANGYGNARGTNQPDQIYGIGGTYGGWANAGCSTSTLYGANSFSVCMSSWTFYCETHNLTCFLSTPADEGSNSVLAGEINTLSTWLSTVPAAGYNGLQLPMMQTDSLFNTITYAPNVAWPFGYSNLNASSSSYQVVVSSIMAGNGPTGNNGEVWQYNGGAIGLGAAFAYDEAGEVPEANYLGLWKKFCYDGKCHGGFYYYFGNLWIDSSNGNVNRDIYNKAMNFGFDNYPSTSAEFGHHGFDYSEGDGILTFPGTVNAAVGVSTTPSFGFNGPIAAFTLKKARDGINDIDIANLAYAINPSSTTAIVNNLWPQVMWDVQCFTAADCSYAYGDRSWAYGQNAYTVAREQLLETAANGPSPNVEINGPITIQGNITIQ